MKEHVIRLTPRSGFEITLHSDTLFGAICWGIRMLFGEEKLLSVIEEFKNTPPFLLSSAFPWKEARGKTTYYLPKPILPPLSADEVKNLKDRSHVKIEPYHTDKFHIMWIAEKYKQFKKLQWIHLDRFKNALQRCSEGELFIDYLDGYISELRFTNSGIAQKNSLDRLTHSTTGAGEVFFTPDISFRERHGLYFLLRTNDIDNYLRPVLMFLQDSGIGPNARTGKNWFSIEIEEKSLIGDSKGKAFITLSRLFGTDQIRIDNSFYHLTSVRSKVESRLEFAGEDVWKDQVMYFAAGSILTPLEQKLYYGRLMPVKEVAGKTIYQYGYAYPAWISSGGNYGL